MAEADHCSVLTSTGRVAPFTLLFDLRLQPDQRKFEVRFGEAARVTAGALLVDADPELKNVIAALDQIQPWPMQAVQCGRFKIKASQTIGSRAVEDLILAGAQSGFRGESLWKVFGHFAASEWKAFEDFGLTRIHPRTLFLLCAVIPVCYDRITPPGALRWFFRRVGGFNRLGKLDQVKSLAFKVGTGWRELQGSGRNAKWNVLETLGADAPPWILETARGDYAGLDAELKAKAVVALFGRDVPLVSDPEWGTLQALFHPEPERLIQAWSQSPKTVCKTAFRCVRAWAKQTKQSPPASGLMAGMVNGRRAFLVRLGEAGN
jgi:hypothetical protein